MRSGRSLLLALLLAALIAAVGSGCAGKESGLPPTAASTAVQEPPAAATATVVSPPPTAAATERPPATDVPAPTPAVPAATAAAVPPFTFGEVVACGRLLPILSAYDGPLVTKLYPDPQALAETMAGMPAAAQPALQELLQRPGSVGLAAYRAGEKEAGVFLNAAAPMPLASVVKVVHLVAYAEAAAAGELSPTETVPLADLDRFYLPTLDLRAHSDAVDALQEEGLVFGEPPAALLDEVAGMMIEFSSNAATDYMHMKLGQERIEETAQRLGLGSQTAPCPFAGQFLAMANHTRPQVDGRTAVNAYVADPAFYGEDVMQLTAAFSEDETFHEEAIAWRRQTRRPTGFTQRLFSEQLNAQGTAVEYADLMLRLAQNGLRSPESSFIARRHLEWPMRFPENQALFSNVAYKGGSLPGILTTVYYAYPLGSTQPVVVALFYRDLHNTTYRQWRRSLAHDEFARWLLSDPGAIPALRALLETAEAAQTTGEAVAGNGT